MKGDARRLTRKIRFLFEKFASGHYFDAMAGFRPRTNANFFAEGRESASSSDDPKWNNMNAAARRIAMLRPVRTKVVRESVLMRLKSTNLARAAIIFIFTGRQTIVELPRTTNSFFPSAAVK